jgi:hypothetical protein
MSLVIELIFTGLFLIAAYKQFDDRKLKAARVSAKR